MPRWDGFSDDELRDLDRAMGVDDQEYGTCNPDLWREIKDEILRREYPDPVIRLKMVDWDAAIKDHQRFPTPFEAMLRSAYEPAVRHYLTAQRVAWLEG